MLHASQSKINTTGNPEFFAQFTLASFPRRLKKFRSPTGQLPVIKIGRLDQQHAPAAVLKHRLACDPFCSMIIVCHMLAKANYTTADGIRIVTRAVPAPIALTLRYQEDMQNILDHRDSIRKA